mmetsp:Transcript_22214/g.39287  ORF Transcript_22214/g.39287 Transcript_22214/m.39287 type:complete len:134 (+) Transcript_22214:170-571(+)|eukprot:CAMPEP_0171489544 /NCGR_PEP_ID=MMETSP0958-20121227/2817_1 /TAXON_ID=87120 /ORGANISM="Aurantiochytrium limacinum, Strain ATCCMYA-1381" /LENGTH=133 /DNA_ID=CAMNT_0012022771 /DNA_START=68 /DNA_END=469 /DNA_ORIENTATION=+
MPLTRLAYISKLRITPDYVGFEDEFVERIRKQSEFNNRRREISGVLLYNHDTQEVVQVLEGEEDVIKDLLETIKLDNRHRNMRVMSQMTVTERQYSHWGMLRGGGKAWKLVKMHLPASSDPAIVESFDNAFDK